MPNHYLALALALSLAVLAPACSSDKSRPGNAPPSFTSNSITEVKENSKGVIFSLSALEPDGDDLHFSLLGPDAQWFSIDRQSGDMQFIQPPDFEKPKSQSGDNQYQLVAVATDSHGAQAEQPLTVKVVNVEFAYEILSPLPNTILEFERYSRLPLAVWVEYDYPERLQIIANGEILNRASDSGASWTGSISMADGEVNVEMLFWRGDDVLQTHTVPVRHQHVISAARNLAYDGVGDRVVIPHEQRLETLAIDLSNGQSSKAYPWVSPFPSITDIVFDSTAGSMIYAAGTLNRLTPQGGNTALPHNANTPLLPWGLSYDARHNDLFVSHHHDGSRYMRLDLDEDIAQEYEYGSERLQDAGPIHLANDSLNGRLFAAPSNAMGVEVIDVASNAPLASFATGWPSDGTTHRFGKIAYDPTRDALFLANPSIDSIVKLDTAGGGFSIASGEDVFVQGPSRVGSGAPLQAPYALAIDRQRDRLLTLSAARLLAINPDTGEREVVFDSVAGTGDLSSGFAATWVARDGSRARAIDSRFGRFFEIDLRTGLKTAEAYAKSSASPPAFTLTSAKISSDGHHAAVHVATQTSPTSTHGMINRVDLHSGASQTLLHLTDDRELIHFNFSWPDNKLIVASRSQSGELELHVFSISDTSATETPVLHRLPITSNTELMAVHLVHDQFYFLERVTTSDAAQSTYRLASVDSQWERTELLSTPMLTDGQTADLNTMADASLLVMIVPGQPAQFWDIEERAEASIGLAFFRGNEQPRDFYTIDDFNELLYFRTNAGLQLCWRLHCAILAN